MEVFFAISLEALEIPNLGNSSFSIFINWSFEYSCFLYSAFSTKTTSSPFKVLFIQCSMPSAILTYLVGSMYSSKKVVNSIAGTIVVSTVGSFLTLPVIVFIALKYFY